MGGRSACTVWLSLLGAVVCGASSLRAQLPAGEERAIVAGRVVAADNGEPIRFSLIVLAPLDTTRLRRALLTDSAGGFVFSGVAPGDYRLRVDRIGYEPEPIQAFHVAARQMLALTLRSAPRPVHLAAITVNADGCYTAGELEAEPALATLWREAQKAAEIRALFDRMYSYAVDVGEELRFRGSWRPSYIRNRVVTSTPVLAAALADSGADAGYGIARSGGVFLAAPELPELLGTSFTRTHCLGLLPDRKGEHQILFRPLGDDSSRIDLAGTIVLDAAFQVKRLEFEYRQNQRAFARGSVEYGNVSIVGSQLRFARKYSVQTSEGPLRVRLADGRLPDALRTLAPAGAYAVGDVITVPLVAQTGTARMGRYRDFVRDTTAR